MKVSCSVQYITLPGFYLYISGSSRILGKWDIPKALRMKCANEDEWTIEFDVSERSRDLEYKYFVADKDLENITWESGENRVLRYFSEFDKIETSDSWRENNNKLDILKKSVFKDLIFIRVKEIKLPKEKKLKTKRTLIFHVKAPKLDRHHKLCIVGNVKELGEWNHEKALIMDNYGPSSWSTVIKFTKKYKNVYYKYGIFDTIKNKVISLETGNDRLFSRPDKGLDCRAILRDDDIYKYSDLTWHGAGVAIPVFSLRTKNSMGVGEFLDIKLLVDWCKKTNMKMIQILPVNDTISTHTWVDSYPYSAISAFALHPIYLNLKKIKGLPIQLKEMIDEKAKVLNENEAIDYEKVMDTKTKFILYAYKSNKRKFLNDRSYKSFLKKSRHWLIPYAAYCFLRDKLGTHNHTEWGKYAKFNKKLIDDLCSPTQKHFDDIAIHYFIQYHLHKQLLEASEYARANGIVLKGDIPIGVNRYGIDTWMEPELFNMKGQTGAPPDDFSVNGQNWGFPPYNWEEMALDGFKWWQNRLKNMSIYFDAFRIDHILGFFRIWEIPLDAVTGLLGYFKPAVPIEKSELESLGIDFNEERFCKPFIRSSCLYEKFGKEYAEILINNFLEEYKPECYSLKTKFKTQRMIEKHFESGFGLSTDTKIDKLFLKEILFSLVSEVLFIKDTHKKNCYHPRISFDKTNSYQALNSNIRDKIYNLYLDYFYNRQEKLWKKQALIKLPALINATNMLVCGEDLGMIPDCVPGIMEQLALLSLKIQRMPKETHLEFGIPSNYPYISVCTTSSHDMSTLRGWWEENRDKTQRFYNNILKHKGIAPQYCEPSICKEIINQHLDSPCMWAVFPIQDLLAIDENLRRKNPYEERINEPSNPNHYWQYRFHINLEDLLEELNFNSKLQKLIEKSGRISIVY